MRGEWIWRYVRVLRGESVRCAELPGVSAERFAGRLERLCSLRTREDLLHGLNMVYMAPADAADTALPDRSVDLVFSHGVVEHIPLADLERLMCESRRILADGGVHITTSACTIISVAGAWRTQWMSCAIPISSGD